MLTNTRRLALVSLLTVGLLSAGPAYAAKPGKKKKPTTPPAESSAPETSTAADAAPMSASPATATVTRGPIKTVATLTGVVESAGSQPLSLAPEEWTQLVVKSAVPAGERVAAGDVVVQFDTTKLTEAIANLKEAQAIAELTIQQHQNDLKILEQSQPLQAQLAEREKQHAEQDLARFVAIEGPFTQRTAEEQVKMMEQYFEYTQEELKQLEKMYKADDLTDDTEEIILKRARNDVEQMRFALESARQQSDQQLKVQLPRSLELYQTAAQAAALSLQRAQAALPLQITRQKLELEKLSKERQRNNEKLAGHERDLKLLTVKAPIAGYVYYGQSTRGKWNSADLAPKLRPGGTISAHEVLATIVPQQNLYVRATLPEKELVAVTTGVTATLHLPALGKNTASGKLRSISSVPVAEGSFEALIDFSGATPSSVVAGMTCEAKVITHFQPAATLAPAKAVFTNEVDDTRYVLVVKEGEEAKQQTVTVGATQGEAIEILTGLEPGAQILLEKPAATQP